MKNCLNDCMNNPKKAVSLALRLSFGLSLLLVGVVHYQTIEAFQGMTAEGLGALSTLATIWAYILPGLMIVGGALLAMGKHTGLGALLSGAALASIPVGLLLKAVVSGVPLPDMMAMVNNTFIWLIVYALVVKTSCCGDKC